MVLVERDPTILVEDIRELGLMSIHLLQQWRRHAKGVCVPVTRGQTRQAGIPSVQCNAKTRRGTLCRNFASVGRLQCRMHWGNTTPAIRKGEERATFAQLLQGDPRPVGEVLLDALHNADVAMRDMRAGLVQGEPVTIDTLDRFINLSRLTHHLAKTTVDAGILTKLVEQQRVSLAEVGQFIADTLMTVLDAVPLHPAWRQYLLEVAEQRMLEVAHTGTSVLEVPGGPAPAPPVPPEAPILRPLQGSPPIG